MNAAIGSGKGPVPGHHASLLPDVRPFAEVSIRIQERTFRIAESSRRTESHPQTATAISGMSRTSLRYLDQTCRTTRFGPNGVAMALAIAGNAMQAWVSLADAVGRVSQITDGEGCVSSCATSAMSIDVRPLWPSMAAWYGLVDRFRWGERVDGGQILRLLADRGAVARAEWLRLEQEASRITALIELVTAPVEPVPAASDPNPDGDFAGRLLVVPSEAARPMRCREMVAVLGEDPSVARHGERVRHRLKKLATAGLVREVEPGAVHSGGGFWLGVGVTRPEWRRRGGGLPGWPGLSKDRPTRGRPDGTLSLSLSLSLSGGDAYTPLPAPCSTH